MHDENDSDNKHGSRDTSPTISQKRLRERELTPFVERDDIAELSEMVLDAELGDSPMAAIPSTASRKQTRHVDVMSNDVPREDVPMVEAVQPLQGTPRTPSQTKPMATGTSKGTPTPVSRPKHGKPKLADFDNQASMVVMTANEIFRALLLSEDPFPDESKQLMWIKGAWTLA